MESEASINTCHTQEKYPAVFGSDRAEIVSVVSYETELYLPYKEIINQL